MVRLVPLQTFRDTSNRIFVTEGHEPKLLIKEYVGPQSRSHCKLEREILQVWLKQGFRVPVPHDLQIKELEGAPYLATEFLDYPTLQQQLRNSSLSQADKLELLEMILRENQVRHSRVLVSGERRLIHYDPNTSNILCGASTFCFIDFEHEVNDGPLAELVSLEIAKFTRWAVRDMRIEAMKPFLHLVVSVYGEQRVLLETIVKRTLDRPFQFYHRWRDTQRKQKNSGEVSKYDIADGLKSALGS